MAVKKFDKVYYRTAATPVSSVTYADPPSGWTAMPAGALLADKAKNNLDKDVTEPLGDGTIYVGSEKAAPEFALINFAAADFGTIRTALINNKVDILLIDSQQKSPAYATWGVRLYPKLDGEGGTEPKITLSGEVSRGIAATNPPFSLVTVS